MRQSILLVFFAVSLSSYAQVYRDRIGFELESISHLDIGWMKIYKQTTPPQGKQLEGRTYSSVQIGYTQKFMEWMQQSYVPKGCLGSVGYYQNAISKFSNTNSRLGNARNTHLTALPHLYGAYSKMYMYLKKDAAGKFVPQNNFGEFWFMEANQIQHISNPVSFISSPEEYYFVLPNFTDHPKGYFPDDKKASIFMGFDAQTNLAAHKHFYIPPKTIGDYPYYVVIMTKDHQLPFEEVTIGEFFSQVDKLLPFWQGVDPVPAEVYATAQKNLARLKAKYKNNWNDIARLTPVNTDISIYDFVNATEEHEDFFDNRYIHETSPRAFPIMKVKRSVKELCKTDQPQWIVVRWSMGMPNQAYNIHLHKSILNNFNFDYLYNYFFDPEKVKGQVYKPLHDPL